MYIGGHCINWVESLEYLGVNVTSGKKLSFDLKLVKQSFYAACNCISARDKFLDELVLLSLQESYFLPILTYSGVTLSLTVKQTNELTVCWNSMYRRIFHFNRWESVKCFADLFKSS
jgi:hypothetical protein